MCACVCVCVCGACAVMRPEGPAHRLSSRPIDYPAPGLTDSPAGACMLSGSLAISSCGRRCSLQPLLAEPARPRGWVNSGGPGSCRGGEGAWERQRSRAWGLAATYHPRHPANSLRLPVQAGCPAGLRLAVPLICPQRHEGHFPELTRVHSVSPTCLLINRELLDPRLSPHTPLGAPAASPCRVGWPGPHTPQALITADVLHAGWSLRDQ